MLKQLLLLSASLSLVSCGTFQGYAAQEASPQATSSPVVTSLKSSTPEITNTKTEKVASNSTKNRSKDFPEIATVKQLKTDDNLGCSLTLEDSNGEQFTIGTSLAICDEQASYINQKVRPVYEQVSSGAVVVTSLERLNAETPSNSQTFTSGKWTITIGNLGAWSGVNNTGNATYRGCDAQGNCINLAQGRTVAGQGLLITAWQSGDYTYIVQSPISDRANSSEMTLIVRRGDTEILRESGFQAVSQ